jgi:hypothetical protein
MNGSGKFNTHVPPENHISGARSVGRGGLAHENGRVAANASMATSGLQHQMSYVETEGTQYNGVSNLYQRKGSVKNNDFAERFQGRNSLMNKEGHIGIVKNTN